MKNDLGLVLSVIGLTVLAISAGVGIGLLGWHLVAIVSTAAGLFGTVVVTYKHAVSGTTPPTAIQASKVSALTALVSAADADTTFTITHNWNLTAAQLAALQPWISWVYDTGGTGNTILAFSCATNSITVTKGNGAGSGGTYRVTVLRPNTLIQ